MGWDAAKNNQDNTLHLSSDRLSVLMDELDQANAASSARRKHTRMEYRRHAVQVEVYQPSGGSVSFFVACRNLSRGGMSVLHSSYMHIGTKCRVQLRHREHGEQWITAEVVQCRHVSGKVHDVGLKFTREIDVNDYARIDPLDESFSLESVEPQKLSGRILLVTASDIERKLIEVYLSETSIRMVHVEQYGQMAAQLSETFQLALVDFDMDLREAQQTLRELRQAGHSLPVIAISGDRSVNTRDAIREARASAFIPKPIERNALLRALAEFIILNRSASEETESTEAPSAPTDPSLKALAELFAQDLHKFAEEIESAAKKGDEKSLRYVCARIRGTGPLLGHAPVADAAGRVLEILDKNGTIETAQEAINTLVGLCKRAKSAA